jgi:hypothetical protein
MPYFMIEDFAAGVDVRKSTITAKAGTLRILENGFVNPGGEIEKRRQFKRVALLAGQTAGLGALNNEVYVFGTDAPGAVTVPAPLKYQQLTPSDSTTILRVLDTDIFLGKFFVVARMSDGSIRRFYDGTQVTGGGGTGARSHASKIFTVDSSLVRFSAVNNPADWAGTGSGSIDATTQDAGSADLIGIERYYDYLALMGRRSIQIWAMDADPAKSQIIETLANTGLAAPQACVRYGSGDVLYLSNNGIRSLRARDSSNSAVINDLGSPIDPLILDRRLSLSEDSAERIWALVDPVTGHYWLAWGDTIFVLAYYPGSSVSAWSTFKLPYSVDHAVSAGARVAVRSSNEVFVYGGFLNPANAFDNYVPSASIEGEYDDSQCVVVTPMMDLGKPATTKLLTGIDLAIEGTWKLEVCPDPLSPDAWNFVGTFTQSTYSLSRIPISGNTTHLALRLTSQGTGRARIGAIAIHYGPGDAQ